MAKILLLEDVAAFRRVVSHVLSEEGHTVVESETGEIAYDANAVANADIMITDLNMPSVNGVEAINAARKHRTDLKIIAISGAEGLLGEDSLLGCLKIGADAILRKPFEPEQLVATVREALVANRVPVVQCV